MVADRILVNGRVVTLDPERPFASAVALGGGRIVAVGDDQAVRQAAGHRTEVLDLRGRTVVPGFNDAHSHPTIYGQIRLQIDCRPETAESLAKLVALVEAEARRTEPGRWIRGWGFHDSRLAPKGAITRHDLDPVSPHHPVYLVRSCGHVLVANSEALRLAQITRETPDPPGGKIDRDAAGEPTGMLRETALDLVYRCVPPPTDDELRQAILRAGREYLATGITSVQSAGANERDLAAYVQLAREGALPLRVSLMIDAQMLEGPAGDGAPAIAGTDWLKAGTVKIMLDGGIGAKTAAQTLPYRNEPDNRGILWIEQEKLDRIVDRAHRAGYQVATHAIGDRAIASVLDAYGRALAATPRADHRLRIEHCSLPTRDLVERIARMQVVVSVQPYFSHDAGDVYEVNLGEQRAGQVLPIRRFLDARIHIAGSSDSPVSAFDPLKGMQAAVTRRTIGGKVVGAGQEITTAEALRMYTVGGAYASREEAIKGMIRAGMLADLVVLERDPLDVLDEEVGDIGVDATLVGAKVAYVRPGAAF